MALSSSTVLYFIELVIYLALFPTIAYLGRRHGKTGILGFLPLSLFAALRIVSDILFIAQRNRTTPSTAVSIVSSIGLSPLLLALAGLIHEQHVYLVNATCPPDRAKTVKRWLWVAQAFFHTGAVAGIGIVIAGTVNLIDDLEPKSGATSNDIKKDENLREAGSIVLLVVWINLLAYAIWLCKTIVSRRSPVRSTLRWFSLSIVVAATFVGVRALYGVVYSFDHNDATLNPVTGSFAVKLVLIVLVQLLAVMSLVAGAWKTKDIKTIFRNWESGRRSPNEGFLLLPSDAAVPKNTAPAEV